MTFIFHNLEKVPVRSSITKKYWFSYYSLLQARAKHDTRDLFFIIRKIASAFAIRPITRTVVHIVQRRTCVRPFIELGLAMLYCIVTLVDLIFAQIVRLTAHCTRSLVI